MANVMPPRGSSEYRKCHETKRKNHGLATEYGCWWCDNQADEWAWIHDTDPADLDSYIALCYTCHRKYDNKWSKAERQKVSKSLLDYWSSEEGIARREAMIGQNRAAGKRSEESRANIGRAKLGNSYASGKRTPEQRERIRKGRWG